MNADRAAELLQIPERGLDLLRKFEEEESVQKAIAAVQAGFAPGDVAAMYDLPYEESLSVSEIVQSDGSVHVYECQTKGCRLKGRVATCSLKPDDEGFVEELIMCPKCRQKMVYQTTVDHEDEIGELRRVYSARARIHDSMHGVDKASASEAGLDDD